MPLEDLMSRIKNNSGNLPGGFKKNCLPKISQNLKFPETALTKGVAEVGSYQKPQEIVQNAGYAPGNAPYRRSI